MRERERERGVKEGGIDRIGNEVDGEGKRSWVVELLHPAWQASEWISASVLVSEVTDAWLARWHVC